MHSVSRPVRRLATILTSIGLAGIVAAGSVLAGTPVTVGWRDHAYSGGATRPSSDKPQSKLWYTPDGQWWGGMFYTGTVSAPRSEFRIFKLSADKSTWTATSTVLDTRDGTHGDYLFDEDAAPAPTLFVASVANPNVTAPFVESVDGIRIYKATYSDATGTYSNVAGFPVTIPGTASTATPEFRGGAWTVSIDRDSSGRLWAAWPKDQQVMYSTSDDGGVTWTTAAVLPAQGANTINKGTISSSDTATVIAFGNGSKDTIGVAWSDQDASETAPGSGVNGNGYYFATIAAGADPTVEANWTKDKLPTPSGVGSTIYADNHINIKGTSDGTLYMVGKARTDTVNCATLKERLLTPFYRRTAGGAWSVRLAGTTGDCETRPQIVIDEQLDTAYIFLTAPNGGGSIYRKAAPLTGPDAFDFRGGGNTGDTLVKRGVPFIRSATETLIDDASTTKQVVTSTSGIAVIANNLTSSTSTNKKFYLHNYMSLPASDGAGPSGTIEINGGAATTDTSSVTLSVPATDAGSGMALVRISNSSAVDGNNVLSGAGATSYSYTPTVSWTLAAGLGTQTVYAQWRDAAGNWSAPVSDTIDVVDDTTRPIAPASVSYALLGDGRQGIPVKLSWTAGTDNKAVQGYRIYKQVNGGAVTTSDVPATPLYSYLELPKTAANYKFCVRTIDTANLVSSTGRCVSFNTAAYSEASGALKYSSGWGLASSPVYVGGQAKYSKTAGRSVTFTFTGNRFAWLSRVASTNGSAKVYVDGVLSKTVSLYGTTAVNQKVAYSKSWTSIGTHTIKIVVSGTAGHPTVIVDQLYVLK